MSRYGMRWLAFTFDSMQEHRAENRDELIKILEAAKAQGDQYAYIDDRGRRVVTGKISNRVYRVYSKPEWKPRPEKPEAAIYLFEEDPVEVIADMAIADTAPNATDHSATLRPVTTTNMHGVSLVKLLKTHEYIGKMSYAIDDMEITVRYNTRYNLPDGRRMNEAIRACMKGKGPQIAE